MLKLNKKGVTLIELIVSFALVATAVIYFYQTLSTVYDLYVTSRKETQEFVDKDYAMRIVDAYVNEYGSNEIDDICGAYIECTSVDFDDSTISNTNIITIYKDNKEWIKYYIPNNLIEIIGNKIKEFLDDGEGGFDDVINDIKNDIFPIDGIVSANIKPIIQKDDLGNDVIYGTIYIKLDNGWEGVVTSEGKVISKQLFYIDDVENNISDIIEENYDKKTEDVEDTILSEYEEIFDGVEYLREPKEDVIKLKYGEEVLHTYTKPFELVDTTGIEFTTEPIEKKNISGGWDFMTTYYFDNSKYKNVKLTIRVETDQIDNSRICSFIYNYFGDFSNMREYAITKDEALLHTGKDSNWTWQRIKNKTFSIKTDAVDLKDLTFTDNTVDNYKCIFTVTDIERAS